MSHAREPLTIAVTGASGFIGRAVVACARARGHDVIAIVRTAGSQLAEWDEGVTPIVADLLEHDNLGRVIAGADVVVHLAARMEGAAQEQRRNTVDATRELCAAVASQPVIPRLVLISSIAVYGYDTVPEGGVVDEDTPLEAHPERRDVYCQNKLRQEQITTELAARHAIPLTILRPGAVYGQGKMWNGHLGAVAGPVLVQFARKGAVPVIYVGNCALAIVKACETRNAGPINLIDPDPPDRGNYLRALGWQKPSVVFPWRVLSWIGHLLPWSAKPGLLHPSTLKSRMMPMAFGTDGMRHLLADEQCIGFDEAMQISRGAKP